MKEIQRDLTRTVLAVLCIILLIAASFWVLRPFLAATVWATMIVVATWPLFRALEARLGNRRAPAVAIMTLAMLLLLVLPLWLAIDTILEHSGQLTAAGKSLAADSSSISTRRRAAASITWRAPAWRCRQLSRPGVSGSMS
mgnify:CR=1 FL=1